MGDFLDINFTTVTRAYRLCELKGLIYAVTGSGTFVAPNAAKSVTIFAGNLADSSIDLGFVSSFEQCNDMIGDAVVSVMKKRRLSEHPLSFYRWLPIRDKRRGSEVEKDLMNAGIRVYHSDRFLSGPREEQCYLRVSPATVREKERLKEGLSVLAEHL